ncbi:hypothetical protein LPB72_02290 [Hydrogenophaga crassostreae]|uniref:Glyoxalase-like domain-containing protein n=1 Tax=Hydrogenophaga crassostreae TaxID=1763535 RepID=A0A167IZJ9_9BURK|nr:VOC family protein [Hydrogenophaga crassostreae]AOW11916.1 hypothetical protein LPB072_02565 [Hydrogenophaga crassostreae]OAD43864.1 hypothetical protein LPB72_02290 [Hydrogenophaga crassostreae]
MRRPSSPQLDHLVIAAATLEEGVAWCEATLGVTPGPGGEHALFATHNRLLKLGCHNAPNAYLEIIAINPGASPTRAPPFQRWFDLDTLHMRRSLAKNGPQLVHWVASVPHLDAALTHLQAQGIERGTPLTASRPTPQGLLQWQISVRDDGQRLFDGCLPTLIEWGDTHPAESMPVSGVHLNRLGLVHPHASELAVAIDTLSLVGVSVGHGEALLQAELATPQGLVTLRSNPVEAPT